MHSPISWRNFLRSSGLAMILACAGLILLAPTASAGTMYLRYNAANPAGPPDVRYTLGDAGTGAIKTDTLTLAGNATGYLRSNNASFYSIVQPNGNSVVAGTWTLNFYAYSTDAPPPKMQVSAEIGEYTSGGAYNPWITNANFGWTSVGRSSTLYTITYADPTAHTVASGGRLYVRIWFNNTHTQSHVASLNYDNAAQNSNIVTPSFAKPIPSLGWYLVVGLIIIFIFFAVRRGVLRVSRDEI